MLVARKFLDIDYANLLACRITPPEGQGAGRSRPPSYPIAFTGGKGVSTFNRGNCDEPCFYIVCPPKVEFIYPPVSTFRIRKSIKDELSSFLGSTSSARLPPPTPIFFNKKKYCREVGVRRGCFNESGPRIPVKLNEGVVGYQIKVKRACGSVVKRGHPWEG